MGYECCSLYDQARELYNTWPEDGSSLIGANPVLAPEIRLNVVFINKAEEIFWPERIQWLLDLDQYFINPAYGRHCIS